jgi:urease accessory protein
MGWRGQLTLDYRRDGQRCVVLDRHDGPLRVLASLYPESPSICHNVLLHPPGGIVGGDELHIAVTLAEGTHALLTTPGATRFYRSAGDTATQSLAARVAADARLEWLPLESIAHSGCIAENRMRFELVANAEMIGWDVLALGLPASGQAFELGRFTQSIELPATWLERGVVDASDRRLLDSPLGWAGQRVLGTLWFASGAAMPNEKRSVLLDAARAVADGNALRATAGCTSPNDRVAVLRVLAPNVESAMNLLKLVWTSWRDVAWGLEPCAPRVWKT